MKPFDAELDRVLSEVAKEVDVDPNLLRAISIVETNANGWRPRYEPDFKYLVTPEKFAQILGISRATEEVLQKISWGPMQIMGAVARENGYLDHLTKLTGPALAYRVSVNHLNKLRRRYPEEKSVIAAWNMGSPKLDSRGLYLNQAYVDKVCEHLVRLRGSLDVA